MDKLLARCEAHKNSTRGRKTKRTSTRQRNTSKIKQDTLATAQAQATPTQTIDTTKKVPQNESSKQVSTSKQPKDWQQAQTAPETSRMKPDGTPKDDPNSNPVMKHSTIIPDRQASSIKQIDPYRVIADPLLTLPEALAAKIASRGKEHPGRQTSSTQEVSQAPSTNKDEGKNGEGGNGLTPTASLPVIEPHPNARKLNRKAKADVLAMLAMNYTSRAIVIWVMQNYRIRVRRQNIDSYRNKQRSKIGQARNILAKDIAKAVPTALKLNRIAIRDEMIQDLRRKPWKGSQQTINRILDSIKAEMEPLEVTVSVNLRAQTEQQYRDVTDAGVISEAMDKLKAAGMEVAQVVKPELDK